MTALVLTFTQHRDVTTQHSMLAYYETQAVTCLDDGDLLAANAYMVAYHDTAEWLLNATGIDPRPEA